MTTVVAVSEPTKVILTGDNAAIIVQPPPQVIPVVVESGGPQGPPGTVKPGEGDLHFKFVQAVPASIWGPVKHELGKIPSVLVLDSAGERVEGEIKNVSINELLATFPSGAFSGTLYCN